MDRIVFIVVALALLVATQAQADDPWFNAHCEENRAIMVSVQRSETPAPQSMQPLRADKPAIRHGREGAASMVKPRTRSLKPRTRVKPVLGG